MLTVLHHKNQHSHSKALASHHMVLMQGFYKHFKCWGILGNHVPSVPYYEYTCNLQWRSKPAWKSQYDNVFKYSWLSFLADHFCIVNQSCINTFMPAGVRKYNENITHRKTRAYNAVGNVILSKQSAGKKTIKVKTGRPRALQPVIWLSFHSSLSFL